MMRSWFPSTAFTAMLCGGCASTPIHYYSLDPGAESSDDGSVAVPYTVEMKRVRIPAEVDRPEIVVRRTGEQLDVLGNDLWGAPLRDEIQHALLERIRHDLSHAATADSATNPAPRRFMLFVDVERFEAVPARHVLVQAQWRVAVRDAEASDVALSCSTEVGINVTDSIPALVLGYQQALAIIADRIASNVIEPLACPKS